MIAALFHEFLCYGGVVLLPHSYRYAGWAGALAHISTISVATIVLDFWLSPTAGRNVRRIADEYKVSNEVVYALMAANLYLANITTVWLLDSFGAVDALPPSLYDYAAILRAAGSVAVYLLATEVSFTAGHAWLHHTKRGREIHNMHHLCRPASISANLLFHPVDMAVEFGGPFASLILLHLYVFRDPFTFKAAMTAVNLWYTADHDENLGLSHALHHREMGPQVLTIYGRYEWFERVVAGSRTKKAS
mmetsp:Transcript_24812/g.58173  ORF Transcript_24812/g.58173 Transcript_24812/m.58173 type:complete len:248 (+) Transcript_24812:96-839(+)